MPFVFDWNNDSNILNDENILITDLSLDIPQQFCTRGVKAKDGEQLRCTLSGKKKRKQYTPSDHASIVASKSVQVEVHLSMLVTCIPCLIDKNKGTLFV